MEILIIVSLLIKSNWRMAARLQICDMLHTAFSKESRNWKAYLQLM
jgi:hypothetical protein